MPTVFLACFMEGCPDLCATWPEGPSCCQLVEQTYFRQVHKLGFCKWVCASPAEPPSFQDVFYRSQHNSLVSLSHFLSCPLMRATENAGRLVQYMYSTEKKTA